MTNSKKASRLAVGDMIWEPDADVFHMHAAPPYGKVIFTTREGGVVRVIYMRQYEGMLLASMPVQLLLLPGTLVALYG